MKLQHLSCRFWHFFWFFGLPLAVAWITVDILDKASVIEEVEVWYVLLLFAALASGAYSIRNKLPFWQDRDPNSPFNRSQRRKDALVLTRNVRRILKKKGGRISQKGLSEINAAVDRLSKALEDESDEAVADAVKSLDEKTDLHLSFAKKSTAREYLETIGPAILIAVILRLFIVEAFKIPSESMVPTLMVGDHIFVSKYRYGLSIPLSNKRLVRFAKPDHGEVVVFLKPSRKEQNGFFTVDPLFDDEYEMVGVDFIKRIAGLPGDVIELKKDRLFINGKEAPRCFVGKRTYRTLNRFRGSWEDSEADLWVEKNGEHLYTIIEETNGPENDFGPVTVPDDQVFVLGDNRDNSNDSRYWGSVPFDNIKGRAMFIWWSNRRPHGFQWDRVGTAIMGEPQLTKGQLDNLARCENMR